jgi:uncharacterized protein (DUF58 family)
MLKEFDDTQRKRISLVLDLTIPGMPIPVTFFQDVERAISLTASYVMYFMQQQFQIQIITPQQQSSFEHGQRHLFALLRMLALLEPTNGQSRQHFAKVIRHLKRVEGMKMLISVNALNGYQQANFAKIVDARRQKPEARR